MKKYKIKKTKELIDELKIYWKQIEQISHDFYARIDELEQDMAEETGIKGIEIFFCDNEAVGIGNVERTMELIHREELKNE